MQPFCISHPFLSLFLLIIYLKISRNYNRDRMHTITVVQLCVEKAALLRYSKQQLKICMPLMVLLVHRSIY